MTEKEQGKDWIPWRIFPRCENCKYWTWEYWEIGPTGEIGRGWCNHPEKKGRRRTYEDDYCENWEDRWGHGFRIRSEDDIDEGILVKLFLGSKTKEKKEEGASKND